MKKLFVLATLALVAACGQKTDASDNNSAEKTNADKAETTTEKVSNVAASTPETEPVQIASVQADEPEQTPAERGNKLFRQECAVCHTVNEGGPNRIGPNLYGVMGRTAGVHEGFAYSPKMKESGVVWGDETVDTFITRPGAFIRGNRMGYVGLPSAEKRAAIIAYLNTLKSEE